MIDGVIIQPLKQIVDERGKIQYMVRCDSPLFSRFGEVYFSQVNSGVIKGWKRHSKITQHFAVPIGKIQLVLHDDRTTSHTTHETQSMCIGEQHYALVVIPPLVWYAFKGISKHPALIANYIDTPYDPSESETVPLEQFPISYPWDAVHE